MKKLYGFTLVEVVIVIGIIAILTVIVFPSISNIRAKNRDAERIADIAAIQLGLSLYHNQQGSYPEVLDELVPKYVPDDSIAPPKSGEVYEYVPLNRKTPDDPCSYYQLAATLELPNSQVDTANTFSTLDAGSAEPNPLLSNDYKYCGSYNGPGIPNYSEDNDHLIYSVHP